MSELGRSLREVRRDMWSLMRRRPRLQHVKEANAALNFTADQLIAESKKSSEELGMDPSKWENRIGLGIYNSINRISGEYLGLLATATGGRRRNLSGAQWEEILARPNQVNIFANQTADFFADLVRNADTIHRELKTVTPRGRNRFETVMLRMSKVQLSMLAAGGQGVFRVNESIARNVAKYTGGRKPGRFSILNP